MNITYKKKHLREQFQKNYGAGGTPTSTGTKKFLKFLMYAIPIICLALFIWFLLCKYGNVGCIFNE